MKRITIFFILLYSRAFAQELEAETSANYLAGLISQLPNWLQFELFGASFWQWLALILIVFIGTAFDFILVGILNGNLRHRLEHPEDSLTKSSIRPFGVLARALIWWIGVIAIAFPEPINGALLVASQIMFAVAAVWASYFVVDLFANRLNKIADRSKSKFDDLLVSLAKTTLKVILVALALLFLATNLQVDLSGILAGIGIGGLALGLAAQDTVKNLFGLFTVLIDRPFQLGDWVVIGSVEGTVEDIGFRSTRVRTFYNSIVTVPNLNLITANVDNLGLRQYRRYSTTLAVTYDTTPTKIESFCEGIRTLIQSHPYTRKDFYLVHFKDFDDYALNIMLYTFFDVPDWNTEMRERQRLNLDIMRLANGLNVEFAFPTQQLYVHQTAPNPNVKLPRPETIEAALEEGRKQAEKIAKAEFAGQPIPEPVVSNTSDRGPGDDGGEG